MKLEYMHRMGGTALSAPSGAIYDFAADEEGRRLAEVADEFDAEWFLTLTNSQGQPLFVRVDEPKAAPVRKSASKPVKAAEPASLSGLSDPLDPEIDPLAGAVETADPLQAAGD